MGGMSFLQQPCHRAIFDFSSCFSFCEFYLSSVSGAKKDLDEPEEDGPVKLKLRTVSLWPEPQLAPGPAKGC